jgi:uracil-DNA glycosylase family 4
MNADFDRLQHEITKCRLCPRLVSWREKVAREKVRRFRSEKYWGRPVPAFGSPDAAVIVIGLAPAAHGANRTGRMFTGDRSGEWLYEALHAFGFANQPVSENIDDGLTVRDCLVTAVLRCAPPDNKPLPDEVRRCLPYLERELQMSSRKRVVVALGRIAFDSFLKTWKKTEAHILRPTPLFQHGAEYELDNGVVLIASYHPSQQNTQTGRLTRPMFHQIFRRARNVVDAA